MLEQPLPKLLFRVEWLQLCISCEVLEHVNLSFVKHCSLQPNLQAATVARLQTVCADDEVAERDGGGGWQLEVG